MINRALQRTGENRHDLAIGTACADIVAKAGFDEKGGHVVSVRENRERHLCQLRDHQKVKATGLDALFDATIKDIKKAGDKTIVFTNFVDFDSSWGHRRDIAGYAAGLELFDRRLQMMELVGEDDILILTADHGCDPEAGRVLTIRVGTSRYWSTARKVKPGSLEPP